MTFKNQRIACFSLRTFTTHANAPQDLRGYLAKIHQICSRDNFFVDGVNAMIRIAIRPSVVEWEGRC